MQPTQYTIRGSDFQRANTPPSLETGDFVRHVPLDGQKSIPAWPFVILETAALVSQPRRLAHLVSWKGIQFEDYFFFHHPKVSSLSFTDSSQPPRETAWQGTQHETRFCSHRFPSSTSEDTWLMSALSPGKEQTSKPHRSKLFCCLWFNAQTQGKGKNSPTHLCMQPVHPPQGSPTRPQPFYIPT